MKGMWAKLKKLNSSSLQGWGAWGKAVYLGFLKICTKKKVTCKFNITDAKLRIYYAVF